MDLLIYPLIDQFVNFPTFLRSQLLIITKENTQ